MQQLKLHSLKILPKLDLNEKMLMTEIFSGKGVLFIKLFWEIKLVLHPVNQVWISFYHKAFL